MAAHLDGAAVLALATDGGEVTLIDLHLHALLDEGQRQHQASDAGPGNHHF
jgi:hypothetical protein